MSCSVVLQNGVRSSSVYCSTSRGYYIADLLIAASSATILATKSSANDHPVAYVPSGLFAASGLLGIYKRHNCVRWRETAPPEEWARMAELVRRQNEANAAAAAAQAEANRQAAIANAQAQAEANANANRNGQVPVDDSQQQVPVGDGDAGGQQPSAPHGPSSGNYTVNVERHASTDEIGKACTSSPGYPQAAECQYGAVCYANRCTVWCSNEGQCPSGLHCGFTQGPNATKLCIR